MVEAGRQDAAFSLGSLDSEGFAEAARSVAGGDNDVEMGEVEGAFFPVLREVIDGKGEEGRVPAEADSLRGRSLEGEFALLRGHALN